MSSFILLIFSPPEDDIQRKIIPAFPPSRQSLTHFHTPIETRYVVPIPEYPIPDKVFLPFLCFSFVFFAFVSFLMFINLNFICVGSESSGFRQDP